MIEGNSQKEMIGGARLTGEPLYTTDESARGSMPRARQEAFLTA
jgi:hypothetical protein